MLLNMCTIIFSLISFIVLMTGIVWQRQVYSYWRRHKIDFVKPLPLVGNLKDLLLLRLSFGELFRDLYESVEGPVVGIYILQKPAILLRHPALIRATFIKNSHQFLNRYEAADPFNDTLGSVSLPLAKYQIWRPSRLKIAEFFTSGRLKHIMYPKMLEIALDLEQHLARNFQQDTLILEVKQLAALFTSDLTAAIFYGIKAGGLQQGNSVFREQARQLLRPTLFKAFNFFAIFFLPHLTNWLRAKTFSSEYARFFKQLVQENEKIDSTTNRGDNFIDFLRCFQKSNASLLAHKDFVAAQAAIFLLAGFETSSALIAFTLYELAKQPLIQARLRREIAQSLRAENSTFLGYEQLLSLKYLEQCVAEALRLYPAAAFVNRECTQGFSLKPLVDFDIPTGMPIYVSILGLQRDTKYWPDPLRYNPERFSSDQLKNIHPLSYMPFGAGPHGCVGMRLGLLQLKLGLLHILRLYKVEICALTISKIEFNAKSFMLESKNGIYLNFVKDNLQKPS